MKRAWRYWLALTFWSVLAVARAQAGVTVTDGGYQEEKMAQTVYLFRTITFDTGKKQISLRTNGDALGYVNGSWHRGELLIVDVNGERFFGYSDTAGRKQDFVEKTRLTITPGAEAGTLTATQQGAKATVTLVFTARADDDKLEVTVKVNPTQKLQSTMVGLECYPGAPGPRHKLSRAVATPRRVEALEAWEEGKRLDLQPDEPWIFCYDKVFDAGVTIEGDRKAHGGCGLFYVPAQTQQARVQVSAVHIDPRFVFGPDVTEMHFAILDFWDKSNADALAQMKALGAQGYQPGGGKLPAAAPAPAAVAPAPVAPAPRVAPPVAPVTKPAAKQDTSPLNPGGNLTLAEKGRSDYVIYHAADAPSSVQAAAKELQRVLHMASGVQLPIQQTPGARMICLGDSPVARQAGVAGDALPYETYRLLTAGGNLYIVGRDTADGQTTAWSGVSHGTQFGVATFLEQVVGARWLMPGDLGEEIPRREVLQVPSLDLTDGPAFASRTLEIPDPNVYVWAQRHKISAQGRSPDQDASFIANTGHSWDELLPPAVRKAHPEWDAVGGEEHKFCTRQEAAMATFTQNALHWLQEHPQQHMVSASPSDGQQFCRCERCRPFIEKDPHGQDSMTRSILESYNFVARRVAVEMPGHMVGGYAYGRTTYPPAQPIALEPNVYIEWAPLNYYGIGLYKPAYWEEFARVAQAWRSLTPNLGYLNYCHWHRSDSGAPYAPALAILKMQFPVLKRAGFKSVWEFGTPNWAYGGPNNYLLAKLMWNADADVDALYQEWLQLAYGPGASAMQRLYAVLDDGFREFKTQRESFDYHGDNYEIMGDKIVAIYLPRLAEIAALYQQALDATPPGRARQRVEMFGANMVVFCYHLRKAGYLGDTDKSIFYRTDADYDAFIARTAPDVPLNAPDWFWTQLLRLKPMAPKVAAQDQAFTSERRVLSVTRRQAQKPVKIDGRVEITEWEGAVVADAFRRAGGAKAAETQTKVRVTYDAQMIYVAIEADETQTAALESAVFPPNDPRIYEGNTVEVLLNFTDRPEQFWHFTVNPANNAWSGVRNSPSTVAWQHAAGKEGAKWSVEMALPLATLGIDKAGGRECRVNVVRARRVGEVRENSAWNAVQRFFMEPANFGAWQFVE